MTKLFILKPGEHEFMPGSPTRWNNKTLDDAGAIAMIQLDRANLSKFERYPAGEYGNVILDGTDGYIAPQEKTDIKEVLTEGE